MRKKNPIITFLNKKKILVLLIFITFFFATFAYVHTKNNKGFATNLILKINQLQVLQFSDIQYSAAGNLPKIIINQITTQLYQKNIELKNIKRSNLVNGDVKLRLFYNKIEISKAIIETVRNVEAEFNDYLIPDRKNSFAKRPIYIQISSVENLSSPLINLIMTSIILSLSFTVVLTIMIVYRKTIFDI